jgi:hypothetical protein
MAAEAPEAAPAVGLRTVRRITILIPIFGVAGAVLVALFRNWLWTEGILFGTCLAWLNFRWLRRGLLAFTSAAVARGATEKPRGQAGMYLAATFRYGLIGLAVYVIFVYLHVPLLSLVLGLCTLAIAILAASVWEILQSVKRGVKPPTGA